MTAFAKGVQLVRTDVKGWRTHALVVVFADGGPPYPFAFCDRDALAALHEQSGQALREVDGDDVDGTSVYQAGSG
ncbi:MAG: hypothetical protein QOE58_1549 [Actinomycetota bacterium]|nr:hypothetical protein [Actinomycetota bacterium]